MARSIRHLIFLATTLVVAVCFSASPAVPQSALPDRIGGDEKIADLPPSEEIEQACNFIAQVRPGDRLRNYMLRSGWIDVNNDGVAEEIEFGSSGTMAVEVFKIKSPDGKEIQVREVGFEWKHYESYASAWFPFKGRTYMANFLDSDGLFLVYATYITPKNQQYVVCEFNNNTYVSELSGGGNDQPVCEAVQSGNVPPVEPTETEPKISSSDLIKLSFQTFESRYSVDFDNDGELDNLLQIYSISGAGRGCDARYFTLLDSNDAPIQESKQNHLMYDLFEDSRCQNQPRWFRFQGKTYFENMARGNARGNEPHHIHYVAIAEAGRVRRICSVRVTPHPMLSRHR